MRTLLSSLLLALGLTALHAGIRAADAPLPFNGMGERVGEVTDRSALVHVRLTASDRPDAGMDFPGRDGVARIHYGPAQPSGQVTPWRRAAAATDFAFTQPLSGLRPDTLYHYRVEMAKRPGGASRFGAPGMFRTAPAK